MDSEKLKVIFNWVVRIVFFCMLVKILCDVILAEHAFLS